MPKVWKKRNLRVTADGAAMELVDEPSEEASPKQPRVVEAPQGNRVQIKLTELFGDRIPSKTELSNGELVAMVVKAFKDDPKTKKTGLRIPDRKTILHHAGRIKRKK